MSGARKSRHRGSSWLEPRVLRIHVLVWSSPNAEALLLVESPADSGTVWPGAWSPGGKTLAFGAFRLRADIWTRPLDDGENAGEPEVFLETDFYEREPEFLPRRAMARLHVEAIR